MNGYLAAFLISHLSFLIISNVFFALLHLHFIHIFANQCRGIFFLADQEYIVLLCYNETIQTIENCEFALWQFDDITMAVFHHNITIYNHIIILALLHCLIDTVPGTEVSPTEITLQYRYIV